MFIPEAEKTWLIHPLSLFAIRAGLDQIRRWENAGYDLKLSINLTAHNIQDRSLIVELINLIKDYGINPAHLEIEITERFLLTDMDTAVEVLNSLRNLGVEVAIDDFGTGYSTMNYIQKLPITAVKFDQSLIESLDSSKLSQSVIRNLINATKELNITTVAEGVENKELFDKLTELGSDIAQGYYVSKPLAENDFDLWLSSCPFTLNKSVRK
jgi:EAL domain-containing protein (putative c-di-GMP-specific phosphodiesterase class I)